MVHAFIIFLVCPRCFQVAAAHNCPGYVALGFSLLLFPLSPMLLVLLLLLPMWIRWNRRSGISKEGCFWDNAGYGFIFTSACTAFEKKTLQSLLVLLCHLTARGDLDRNEKQSVVMWQVSYNDFCELRKHIHFNISPLYSSFLWIA